MLWEDFLQYFQNIHISWSTDPDFFQYHTAVHAFWDSNVGPNDDSYNVGDNPQYTIKLSKKATLWLLLSRHVAKQEQKEESREMKMVRNNVADKEKETKEVSALAPFPIVVLSSFLMDQFCFTFGR